MGRFDLDALSDQAVRERYSRIEKRGASVASALRGAFGAGRADIRFRFVDDHLFNAFADRDGEDYVIEIAGPVPLLVILLFERLLSEPRVLPWVDATSDSPSRYEVPFIVDPLDFDRRADWAVDVNRDRSFAADFLSDFAVTFILLHEAGHILCGHVDIVGEAGGYRLAEMFDAPADAVAQDERGRAWEADADSVAATLVLDYVTELALSTQTNERAQRIFGRGERTIEHILSILLVALYALFAYLRGMRYAIGVASSHPHPFVRAHYVKDMVFKAARARWELDIAFFDEALDQRLDEMLIVLEEIGLHDNSAFTDGYIEETDKALAEIENLRQAYRRSATAWFDWNTDNDEAAS